MDDDLLAAHVDAIHGVPLDAFVDERDARARQLRADEHREEASALARQRKPTVVAWAVNQLARRHPQVVGQLIDAGRDLHAAQVRATSGRGADGLRAASRRVRDLARELTERATAILEEAGSAPHEAEIEQTLFATATDEEHHDALRRGVLRRAVEVSGFGTLTALTAVPDADAPEPTSGDDADDGTAAAAEDDARAHAEAERQARRRELETRRGELERARGRQQRRVQRQRSRAEDLEDRLAHLQEEVAEARASADAAEEELTELHAELAGLDAELAAADEPT